ncbi:MAG TPA: NAD(P)/FAD-dependent oxidoreductase [Parvularculaceae bacterium]|nr:NAD(P)/FAD-dependent oxidoreductase [Parvularculaceae bacterium]
MLQKTPPARVFNPKIAILGAGFSGMGMAIALKERGLENFTIYEKAADFGGTWRENVYPGIACDVPSHLYSFSFDPNPDWSKRYSSGAEIWDYMRACATKHGLYERAEFGKRILRLAYEGARWRITFADGSTADADIIVSGLGGLHESKIPDFPGVETFAGPKFHTAQWRNDVDLAGKRVAIIGSAASAVQVVPEIAPIVAHLDVFQRTANYILPRDDHRYPAWLRALFRAAPPLARAYRGYIFSLMEARHPAFLRKDSFARRQARSLFKRTLEKRVSDETLRARLTPDYPPGCKRILISDNFYEAIQRENVSLVAEGIERIERNGVKTKDGALHDADVLIFATGFKPFNLLDSVDVIGAGGRSLRDIWSKGVAAHRTVAVPGCPNFFLLLGPNSGLGHNSVILMIEAQVKYVMRLLDEMERRGAASIEPTKVAAAAYDRHVQEALRDRVWATHCGAWYVDKSGRNYTLYPGAVRDFITEMKRPDFTEYNLRIPTESAIFP